MKMQCDQFEQVLEQQDSGPLPKAALSHMDACAACRALTLDFAAIHDAAMELAAEEIAPPEHIWTSLRNQLEAEGMIQHSQTAAQSEGVNWWNAFQRPAFAGAFLAAILIAATAISYRQDPSQISTQPQLAIRQETSTVPSAESIFKDEVLTVGNDSIPGLQKQDAAVIDSIRRNLGIVDNFIAICEKSVREQPDNEMAREYLYGAYQQKAELLATATNRSMTGGLQ